VRQDEVKEIAQAAVDQERLLEGENPQTQHPEDARRWLAVYSELFAYKEGVIARTHRAVEQLAPEAAAEIERTDLPILFEERDRFRRRLHYWQQRVRQLGGGIDFDHEVRIIRHGGRSIRLSRREAELLTYLLEHPGQSFAPRELASRAWLSPGLSSEQVRNYVVRLRRKLSGTDLPFTLVSEPGTGYCLKWS
jgi:DNA-binding response OmpR family regulator